MLTRHNIEEAVKEIDKQWEIFYRKEMQIVKRRNLKRLRQRNFEREFKILVEDEDYVYRYIKYNSKHCWASRAVPEVGKKYTVIRVWG